ncbi:MAG: RNA methyltransferase [Chitinophagales bacterium]
MALSKAKISYIRSLHQKKYRQMYAKFLVEGDKSVRELMNSKFSIDEIFATPTWQGQHQKLEIVSDAELENLSTMPSPDQVIAVACQTQERSLELENDKFYVACDGINDPGNAGTILRIADWFGAAGVLFSKNSVEIYNPKVVSSSKGSIFRVPFFEADLAATFRKHPELPILGTDMHGTPLDQIHLPASGILVMGSEAHGISSELQPLLKLKVAIPSYGKAESLNVGVATGILLHEWRRTFEVR